MSNATDDDDSGHGPPTTMRRLQPSFDAVHPLPPWIGSLVFDVPRGFGRHSLSNATDAVQPPPRPIVGSDPIDVVQPPPPPPPVVGSDPIDVVQPPPPPPPVVGSDPIDVVQPPPPPPPIVGSDPIDVVQPPPPPPPVVGSDPIDVVQPPPPPPPVVGSDPIDVVQPPPPPIDRSVPSTSATPTGSIPILPPWTGTLVFSNHHRHRSRRRGGDVSRHDGDVHHHVSHSIAGDGSPPITVAISPTPGDHVLDSTPTTLPAIGRPSPGFITVVVDGDPIPSKRPIPDGTFSLSPSPASTSRQPSPRPITSPMLSSTRDDLPHNSPIPRESIPDDMSPPGPPLTHPSDGPPPNGPDLEAVSNATRGVRDAVEAYHRGALQVVDEFRPSERSRLPISKLASGGAFARRQREWWMGVCYSASAITGTAMRDVTLEDVHDSIAYLGSSKRQCKRLDLAGAVRSWAIWPEIEGHGEQQVLDQKLAKEADDDGLGWERSDGPSYGVMVKDVARWASFMVLVYEHRSGHAITGTVYFKLAIDSRCHHRRTAQVCEVFLELLHGRDLLNCISIAKFEGRDADIEVLAHICNRQAWPDGRHVFDQLLSLMQDGLQVQERHLQFRLFECHDLACTYTLVTRGKASALGSSFCPWCGVTKLTSTDVTQRVAVLHDDTIASLCRRWHMTISLFQALNPHVPTDLRKDAILLPHATGAPDNDTSHVLIIRDWTMDRMNSKKITPSRMEDLVYCTRHASIRTVKKFMDHLARMTQQLDASHPRPSAPSRLDQLGSVLQQPPLAIHVTLEKSSHRGLEYSTYEYDQSDGAISDLILQHSDLLLEVIGDAPSDSRVDEVLMMWDCYRRFNELQQLNEEPNVDQLIERIMYVAKELAWYASRCFDHFTPYLHLQTAHVAEMVRMLPPGITIGRLKNDMVERKHRKMKNVRNAHEAGRSGPSAEVRSSINGDRMELEKEMQAQYMHLRIAHDDLLKKERPRKWIEPGPRSHLRKIFIERGYQEITPELASELSMQFQGDPSASQIIQYFRNQAQHVRRRVLANLPPMSTSQRTPTSHILQRSQDNTPVALEAEAARHSFLAKKMHSTTAETRPQHPILDASTSIARELPDSGVGITPRGRGRGRGSRSRGRRGSAVPITD